MSPGSLPDLSGKALFEAFEAAAIRQVAPNRQLSTVLPKLASNIASAFHVSHEVRHSSPFFVIVQVRSFVLKDMVQEAKAQVNLLEPRSSEPISFAV